MLHGSIHRTNGQSDRHTEQGKETQPHRQETSNGTQLESHSQIDPYCKGRGMLACLRQLGSQGSTLTNK